MIRERGFGIVVYLLAGLAVLAMFSGIAYKIRESGKDVIRLEWAEANRLQREREAEQAAVASTELEIKREKAKIVYRTIREQVDRIVEREVYRHVCFDDDGLLRANAALIGGAGTAPAKPDRSLSRPVTTFRWKRSLSFEKSD